MKRLRSASDIAARPRHAWRTGTIAQALESRLLWAAHIAGDSTVYSTIQDAVDAAGAGAVINVDPGVYPELVNINKPLTLRGAQAGIDARSNSRQSPANESVLTGYTMDGGSVSSSFYVNTNDVTVDGFTVQGNTSAGKYGAGIVIAPLMWGTHILDNIVQNNISGLFLSNASSTDAALIQHNVFRYNNNAGANGGRGIYTDGEISGGNLTNVTIDSNFFQCNQGSAGTTTLEAAIALESRAANSQSNIRISNNVMQGNGKGVLAYNATGLLIQGNSITSTLDQWSGALRFEGGVTNTTITDNNIFENTSPAINIDSKGFPPATPASRSPTTTSTATATSPVRSMGAGSRWSWLQVSTRGPSTRAATGGATHPAPEATGPAAATPYRSTAMPCSTRRGSQARPSCGRFHSTACPRPRLLLSRRRTSIKAAKGSLITIATSATTEADTAP